jgi:CBS domain-containing membrane protein
MPQQTEDMTAPQTPPRSAWSLLLQWLHAFWPAPVTIDARECWRSLLGATLGMGLVAFVSHSALGSAPGSLWLLAPMGASAVLVFGVPASPLAQPWAVLGGNAISALVGVACARWIADPVIAAGLAVPLAILAMLSLRCLHPPGGAMALSAVLSHWVGLEFPWQPLLLNMLVMLAAAVVYNSLTGRPYPHVQTRGPGHATDTHLRFTQEDLDTALAQYNQILDVSRDDLEGLLQQAEMAAYRRNLGGLACADVMSRDPVAVQFGTPLYEAWDLLHKHRIKALPVIDKVQRIVGIVTVADFMRHAQLDKPEQMGQRFRNFIRRSGTTHSEKPEAVGQIMTRQVRVASASRPLTELMPLFSEDGHHHIPIVDEQSRLVGIITQSDLVRALHRAVRLEG